MKIEIKVELEPDEIVKMLDRWLDRNKNEFKPWLAEIETEIERKVHKVTQEAVEQIVGKKEVCNLCGIGHLDDFRYCDYCHRVVGKDETPFKEAKKDGQETQ